MEHVPFEQPPAPHRRPRTVLQSLRRHHALAVLSAVALLAATACGTIFGIQGSGVPETTSYTVAPFDEIGVSGTFDVEIAVSQGPASVEITVDDNLVDHLDVEVDGTALSIGFDDGNYETRVVPRAVISVADLDGLEVSGASSASVTGIDTDRFTLDISGASVAVVEGAMTDLAVSVSGASSAVIEGAVADDVELDVSGASQVDLTGATVGDVAVELSGASWASVGSASTIDGVLSGASNLEASPDTDVSVHTSGASHVDWD